MCKRSVRTSSYSGRDGPVRLPFIVDHSDPGTLEHVFHLLWSGRGGKVHIFRPLPRQQVPDSTSRYPQLKLVLLKQLCRERDHTSNICRNRQSHQFHSHRTVVSFHLATETTTCRTQLSGLLLFFFFTLKLFWSNFGITESPDLTSLSFSL